ncbi:CIC11C00000002557 [Sungouiella intermedia]|uniref:Actin cytoskeleton-regulatory complex protein END3 n=1 Tax=Sungouiella intermedia TaxID=45354 RepID=A0A1L0DAZ8_9ASCO|nr:CIC11C00000002557 [[Candida] intermedia]
MPRLEEWEIKKYWQIFQGLKPEGNKLTGAQVSPVLKNSRLPDSQLSQIWDLSDIDADGKLDFEEFCITLRLIFDTVNGNISEIPAELPSWLVPLSKAHLILANKAVATGSNSSGSLGDDDDDMLSDDFDWYISPTDKSTYEAIYNSNSDSYGRVRFDSLEGLYLTLKKVPRSDISSAWNLVNPKSFETIDKDQVLVFLHILNQRENGKRIPRGVPASLRATFSKEVPNYDLSSTSKNISQPSSNDKKAFGTNYLNKIGQGHQPEKGTDFSVTEGTDWELVRLRRELANLESLLDKAQSESNQNADGELAVLKFEFEQLLKYKQDKLKTMQSVPNSDKDLTDVKNDVELISTQVQTLEEFLVSKEQELAQLKAQLA